jgi:hypothetical protein
MGADVAPEVLDFLRAQTTLTLATASAGGEPRATALRYANDGVDLYVWMRPSATAAKHLGENPHVSFEIHSEDRGLQGAGSAQPVDAVDAAQRFTDKYALAAGGATQELAFFRITPSSLKLVDEHYAGGRGQTQMADVEYRGQSVYGD